ncbi:MAG TPA: TIR domain-containing protein [Intrasporangium sp.]|uniref:nSTAND1 domain-containing NTPase n=1 Tax=Intrasporangium sp. TaxID=1925024 RepID=UPI002F941FC9
MTGIFISYSHRDLAAALTLEAGLERAGYHVFRDHDRESGIPAGSRWAQELFAQLDRAQVVVFLASDDSLASQWCHTEVAVAVARGRPVIQVAAPPESPGRSRGTVPIHPLLRERQALPDAPTMDTAVDLLVTDLTRLGLGPGNPFSWDPDRSPYPGLIRLGADHASVLFGREAEIATVLDRLAPLRSPGLLVVGPSGCGKSSMVRAGVLPRLAHRPDAPRVLPPVDPGRHPLRQVAAALVNAGSPVDIARLVDDERGIGEAMAVLAAKGAPVVLCIDQAEELLNPEVAEETAALTRRLAGLGSDICRVVVVLRSASLDQWLGDDALAAFTGTDPVWVRPLDRSALRQVILGPARLAGISVEPPELVEQLLDDTGGGQALPLLAALLEELTEGHSRLKPAVISADRYATIGPVARVVERRAADVTRQLQVERGLSEDAVVRAYLRLADVQPNGTVTRGELEVAALSGDEGPIYEALEKYRLVSRDRRAAADGTDAVDVVTAVHEEVFRSWPAVARGLAEQRLDLQTRTWLRRDAHEWLASGGGAVSLTGGRLAQAEEWLRRQGADAGTAEPQVVEYITAATRLRRRRLLLTWATPALAAGLVLLSVIAVLLVRQVGIARDATSATEALRLVGEARAAYPARPDLSLLLALEGAARSQDAQVQIAPFVALTRGPAPRRYEQVVNAAAAGAISADGRRAVVTTANGVVEWERGASGSEATRGSATAVALSSDGQVVALATPSGGETGTDEAAVSVQGWRARTASIVCRVSGGPIERLGLDQRGEQLVVVNTDRSKTPAASTVRVLSASTCASLLEHRVNGLVRDVVLDREHDSIALAIDGPERIGVVLWQLSGEQSAGRPLVGVPPVATAVAVNAGELGALDESGALSVWPLDEPDAEPVTVPALTTVGAALEGLKSSVLDSESAAPRPRWLALGVDGSMRVVDVAHQADTAALAAFASPPLLSLPPLGTRRTGLALDVQAEPGGVVVLDDAGRLIRWRLDVPTAFGDPTPATRFEAVATDGTGVLAAGPRGVWHQPLTEDAKGAFLLDVDATSVAIRGSSAVVGTRDGDVIRLPAIAPSGGGASTEVLRRLDGPVAGVALLQDGATAAVSQGGRLIVVDPSATSPEQRLDLEATVTAMASAGTRLFITARDGRLLVVDLATGGTPKVHAYAAHSGGATAVAVSADGRMLATGGDDRQIALWGVDSSMPRLARLLGHTDMVTALAFSPDGTRLASAGQDLTVRFWDVGRREQLGEPVQLARNPALAFVPGSSRLALAGGGLMLWPMDSAAWRRAACDVLGERRLSQTEIDQYLRGSAPAAAC